jgi:hypothetical protein
MEALGRHGYDVGAGMLYSERWNNALPAGTWLSPRGVFPAHQRQRAVPQLRPAPKPEVKIRSPRSIAPSR